MADTEHWNAKLVREQAEADRAAALKQIRTDAERPPTFITRDSGQRATFDSGMVRDTQDDKPRFDLITPAFLPYDQQMLTRIAALLGRGADKYDDRNWEKAKGVEELRRFRASAFRHFIQWWCSADDGEDHAAAVFFNIQGAEYVWYHMQHPEALKYPGEK